MKRLLFLFILIILLSNDMLAAPQCAGEGAREIVLTADELTQDEQETVAKMIANGEVETFSVKQEEPVITQEELTRMSEQEIELIMSALNEDNTTMSDVAGSLDELQSNLAQIKKEVKYTRQEMEEIPFRIQDATVKEMPSARDTFNTGEDKSYYYLYDKQTQAKEEIVVDHNTGEVSSKEGMKDVLSEITHLPINYVLVNGSMFEVKYAKRANFFGLFQFTFMQEATLDSSHNHMVHEQKHWWSFLVNTCGDLVCQPYENYNSCNEDCGKCGDGICFTAETAEWNKCDQDCII